MDGLQLLLLWRQQAPTSTFVIVSDSTVEEARVDAFRHGSDVFLSRPATEEDWNVAAQIIKAELQKRDGNATRTYEVEEHQQIADVVQMNCLSGNSVALEIRSSEMHGDIFIHGGEVYHAQYPGRSGQDAFQEMMEWDGGLAQIKTVPLQHLPPRTIETPIHELLQRLVTVEPLPGGDRIPFSGRLAQIAGETTAAADISDEAPPYQATDMEADESSSTRVQQQATFEMPHVESHWKVDMMGTLVEGSGVRDAEHCALVTNFIFRKMADIAVALEVDYFDALTLRDEAMQQVLVADHWGVRHAILEADADEQSRKDYLDWCREQSL
jgi:CheY-like chemotaxis protein